MRRRKFLRLLGVGAAAVAVSSQLPASQIQAPSPVTIPVVHRPEPELPMECQVEPECTVEVSEHSNPYLLTKEDLGLDKIHDAFTKYLVAAVNVSVGLP